MIFALALVLAQIAPNDAERVDAGSAPAEAAEAPAPASDAPVTESLPAPPMTAAEVAAPSHGFVKGELSVYLGSDRLSVKRNRVGVSLGVDLFEGVFYAVIEPQIDLRFLDAKLGIGLGVPLRLQIVDLNQLNPLQGAGTLRKADYDSVHDFGRLLKYVNYGKKEDNFYLNIGQRYATSIGHGSIMRRYAPNIDVDYPRVSAEVDAYNDYAGFEAFTNDVLEWNVLSAIAFLKPFSFFKPENLLAKSFSVGVTGALDRNAPAALVYDPAYGNRELTTDNRLAATQAMVGLVGVDAELKVVKTAAVDIKPYVDYSMLVGGGGGLTVGALGRFNVGSAPVNAFRIVLEGRYLGDHYQPSYFDTFYEIDRYQARFVGVNPFGIANILTKRQLVLEQGLGNRAGFYAEASWGIPNVIGLTVAFETATSNAAQNSLIAHLEIPWLNFLQIFGSFYKRDLSSFKDLMNDYNTVFFAGARLRTLPFLFINGRVFKTFRVNTDVQRYDNQFGFSVDLELGFEFGRSRAEAEEIQQATPPPPMEEIKHEGDGPPPAPAPEPQPEAQPQPAPQ